MIILTIVRNVAIRMLIKWEKSRDNIPEHVEELLLEELKQQVYKGNNIHYILCPVRQSN